MLKSDIATTLQRSDYQKVFEAFGGKGLLLDHSSNIRDVLQEARETARKGIPVCINVLIGKTDFRKGSISM